MKKRTAEAATFDSEFFRDVFNASPIGIAVESLEGQPLFVNPAFRSMLGCSNEEELGSKHFVQFSPPEDAERDWVLFQQLRAGTIDHYQLEKRYFRRGGSLVWGRLSISWLNIRSSPLVLAIVEDITERKAAEEARFRHAAIVESSDDAIFSVNLDGIIVSWNAGAQRIYGYSEAEVVGKPVTILLPPELPDEENKILETLKAGNRIRQFETVRVAKTGNRIHLSLSISPVKDSSGRIVGISRIGRDITQRKLAEETLRESEEKFRSVFRDAGVGMVIVSPEGRFLATNLAFCDCLGYTEEELLAKTVHSVTFPEDSPAFSRKLDGAITKGIKLWRFEKRCLHKSGRIVYTESSASLIRNRDGEPQYFVGEVVDVTKHKEAEKTLSDMTRKLIDSQEQERSRIGRELHDDINQKLALLNVELELLQENPSEVGIRVQGLRARLTEISNDVQALSHELHSSKLEYLGLVGGMRGGCREFGQRRGMEIDCRHDVQSTLPREIGHCLFRVLQEALHNAAKHSSVKRIEVKLSEHSGEIHLTIRDMGKGFDVEAVKHGNGLGLTSMRERARLVNGTITIDSKPMCGTTIHIRVPFESEHDSQRGVG